MQELPRHSDRRQLDVLSQLLDGEWQTGGLGQTTHLILFRLDRHRFI